MSRTCVPSLPAISCGARSTLFFFSPSELPHQVSKYQCRPRLIMSVCFSVIRNETYPKALVGEVPLNLYMEICWKLPVSLLPILQ